MGGAGEWAARPGRGHPRGVVGSGGASLERHRARVCARRPVGAGKLTLVRRLPGDRLARVSHSAFGWASATEAAAGPARARAELPDGPPLAPRLLRRRRHRDAAPGSRPTSGARSSTDDEVVAVPHDRHDDEPALNPGTRAMPRACHFDQVISIPRRLLRCHRALPAARPGRRCPRPVRRPVQQLGRLAFGYGSMRSTCSCDGRSDGATRRRRRSASRTSPRRFSTRRRRHQESSPRTRCGTLPITRPGMP